MTDFPDLPEAGASQGADEIAIARGGATLRQTVARIVAGRATEAALRALDEAILTRALQAVIYPHLINVVNMRVAWKDEADIVANPFTAAEFTGANSAAGTTAGVDWQANPNGFRGTFGIWIAGSVAPARLTYGLNALNWSERPLAQDWNGAGALTVAAEDGHVWVSDSNLLRIGRFGPTSARAILDPGRPAA